MLGEGYAGKKRKVSFADTVKGASSKGAAFVPQGPINLDPNLWCSPILGEHPFPSVPVPFPVAGFSSSDSSFSNISSVLPSSFPDRVTTLHPQEAGLTSLLRNGGFYIKDQTRRMARGKPLRMQAIDDELTDRERKIE